MTNTSSHQHPGSAVAFAIGVLLGVGVVLTGVAPFVLGHLGLPDGLRSLMVNIGWSALIGSFALMAVAAWRATSANELAPGTGATMTAADSGRVAVVDLRTSATSGVSVSS